MRRWKVFEKASLVLSKQAFSNDDAMINPGTVDLQLMQRSGL